VNFIDISILLHNFLEMLPKSTDAAKHLGIHPDTLRRWANAGKVKVAGHTPGKQRLCRLSDFEEPGVSPTSRPTKKSSQQLGMLVLPRGIKKKISKGKQKC